MAKLSKLSRSIEGKVALITGAANGMGRATAHLFADEGAHVAVADIDAAGVETVVGEITDAGLSAAGWTLDLTDAAAIATVVGQVADHFGGLDILVNNAGVSQHVKIDDDGYEAVWDRLQDVLLRAHTRTIRAALPYLRASGAGRIVNIASIAGKEGNPLASSYSASKAGLIALTKSLGKELADHNIGVNCLTPAAAKTAIFDQITEDHINYMLSKIPRARFVLVEEIASMVTFMASKENSFTTGGVFDISGGRATY